MTGKPPIDRLNVAPDTPLRLADAVRLAFPLGGMTVSGLRQEARKGRLAIEVIAGKQFTTLRAIEEMRERCRVHQQVSACGSNRRNVAGVENSSVARHGSSETDRVRSARAALE